MIPIDFRQKCSYYVPAVFGSAKSRPDGAFELRRSIFDIVYLSEKGQRAQDRPTNPARTQKIAR